jgi:hypothetical protein
MYLYISMATDHASLFHLTLLMRRFPGSLLDSRFALVYGRCRQSVVFFFSAVSAAQTKGMGWMEGWGHGDFAENGGNQCCSINQLYSRRCPRSSLSAV